MPNKVLFFILLASISASAQVQRYDSFAATTASASGIGNLVQAIPNATVSVFTYPGAGVSCAGGGCTAATTYTSRTGLTTCGAAVPLTRPTATSCIGTADSQGNFGFWAVSGAYQYCISATNFTTQCYNAIPGIGGNVSRIVNGPGDLNWAGSDDGARINSALASLNPGGGEVWLVPGTYSVSTTIREGISNTRIKCMGLSQAFNTGGPSCQLNWTGASNGVMALVDSANTSVIVGDGFSGVFFNANSLAGTCLAVLSAEYGTYEDLQCSGGFTGSATINSVSYNGGIVLGIDASVTNGPGGVNGTAHTWFKNVAVTGGAANANGWLLTGTLCCDIYMNSFVLAFGNATGTGDGWHIENADNNRWFSINASSATGAGVHLTCTAGASSQNMCARENEFWNANTGSQGVKQDGVSTFYATSNRIYGYEVCNGSPTPSTTLVLKGSLTFDVLDCGDNVFAQYNFSVGAAGTSFLSQINNYKTGAIFYGTSTLSNPFTLDSSAASVNKCIQFSDNAVAKWLTCSGNTTTQEYQIFDSANSLNRFVAGQSGGSSAQIYNTPTGLNHVFRVNNANSISIDKNSIISTGTAATLAGTGACASRSGQLGGSIAGQVTCTGTTGASTLTITPGDTAPNGFSCWANDITHTLAGSQSTASATAPVMTFTTVTASDVVTFGCIAY